MIIPVRCFTCGKVLADTWEAYVRRCAAADAETGSGHHGGAEHGDGERPGKDGKTSRGRILDELGITTCCCRVVMLTHVDLSLVI
jgi:DNA-directed RNA polymerase subunit N (RpoN/RPB10)